MQKYYYMAFVVMTEKIGVTNQRDMIIKTAPGQDYESAKKEMLSAAQKLAGDNQVIYFQPVETTEDEYIRMCDKHSCVINTVQIQGQKTHFESRACDRM